MWAGRGECGKSKQYMIDHCQVSCKYCTPPGPRPKSQAELHPLSVAAISKEIGVTPAPAGTSSASGGGGDASATAAAAAAAVATEAARQHAVAKEEAAKVAAEKAAVAEKPAAGATLAAASGSSTTSSRGGTTTTAAAEGMPSEAQMRSKYATTTLTYAALVKR
jgi:hypothetical protein